MFGRYARLSARPTGGEPSTGLGLSIARKLAQAMHGELICESEPGHGATFILRLPCAANERTKETMDFLVIDDDKTFRDATCLLIEDEGHYAQPAASGAVGLETLKEDPFDAVLLDVNLGEENGLDVLQQILKKPSRTCRW